MRTIKSFAWFILIGIAISGLTIHSSKTANADVVSSTTSSDLTVSDSNGDGIMDSAVSSTDGFIRVFGFGFVQRGVWEYGLSGVSAGATVNSASVLFEDRGTTLAGDMLLFGFSGDGTASISDGDLTATQIGSFTIGANNTDLDYNVILSASFFQGLIDAGALFAGIVMVSTNEIDFGPGADICSFDSALDQCSGTTGSILTLDVSQLNVVPLPAALPLFLTGLAGLGLMRRHKRQAERN